jgi:hypothetical protein
MERASPFTHIIRDARIEYASLFCHKSGHISDLK